MLTTELDDRSTDGWVPTFTGRKIYPLAPRPDDIDICDIAHALACINRFTGHASVPYSVAQHSVMVSRLVRPPLWDAALLHDAAEAYLGDIARPWKSSLEVRESRPLGPGMRENVRVPFRDAEDRLLRCIFAALQVSWPDAAGWRAIKEADTTLLVTEARDFFGHQAAYHDWHHRPVNGYTPLPHRLIPLSWRDARQQFLDRWNTLSVQPPVAIDDEPLHTLWGIVP